MEGLFVFVALCDMEHLESGICSNSDLVVVLNTDTGGMFYMSPREAGHCACNIVSLTRVGLYYGRVPSFTCSALGFAYSSESRVLLWGGYLLKLQGDIFTFYIDSDMLYFVCGGITYSVRNGAMLELGGVRSQRGIKADLKSFIRYCVMEA